MNSLGLLFETLYKHDALDAFFANAKKHDNCINFESCLETDKSAATILSSSFSFFDNSNDGIDWIEMAYELYLLEKEKFML